MRKALLQAPLISFETVVPELPGAGPPAQQGRSGEDDKDRTFLTSVGGLGFGDALYLCACAAECAVLAVEGCFGGADAMARGVGLVVQEEGWAAYADVYADVYD